MDVAGSSSTYIIADYGCSISDHCKVNWVEKGFAFMGCSPTHGKILCSIVLYSLQSAEYTGIYFHARVMGVELMNV